MVDKEKVLNLLGYFTVRDSITVERLSAEELSTRAFFERLINSKLHDSDISLDEVKTWDDSLLLEIVVDWLENDELEVGDGDSPLTLESVRSFLLERLAKQREQFKKIVSRSQQALLQTSKHIQEAIRLYQPASEQIRLSIASQLKGFDDAAKILRASDVISSVPLRGTVTSLLESVRLRTDELSLAQSRLNELAIARSPLLEASRISTESVIDRIAHQMRSAISIVEEAKSVSQISRLLSEQIQPIGATLRAAELSMLAQTTLAHTSFDHIGAAIGLQRDLQQAISTRVSDVAHAYSDHIRSLGVASVEPLLIEAPVRELFTMTEFVEVISDNPLEDEISLERQKQRDVLEAESDVILRDLISDLNPKYLVMLEGASQALVSSNADRVRHFTVSFRELFTHIMHTLAPDDEIRSWSNDPHHFDRNKPTRKARLLYICRGVNHPPLNQFFRKDIEAALELVDVFQGGTHGVEIHLSIGQLMVLKLKMESTIRFILEVNKYNL